MNINDQKEIAEDHFQRCRDLWIRYMRTSDKLRGYPAKDSTCRQAKSNDASSEEDKDNIYSRAEYRTIHVFNACVDSLLPAQRSAIYKAHGLGDAFRFLRLDYQLTLAEGMMKLREYVAKRC